MRDNTPTTQTLDRLTKHGYSKEFISYVTHYSMPLLEEAFKGYISFMGPTLARLIELADIADILILDDSVTVNPVLFIEQQAITLSHDSNKLIPIGKAWADSAISTQDVVELALGILEVTTLEMLGQENYDYNSIPPRTGIMNGSKAGVNQVW